MKTIDKSITGKFQLIKDVYELFEIEYFPYKAKLSFLPLIQYWKNQLDNEDAVISMVAKEIRKMLDDAPEFYHPIEEYSLLKTHEQLVEMLISCFLPASLHSEKYMRISGPFNIYPFYQTSGITQLLTTGGNSFTLNRTSSNVHGLIILRACLVILNKFYNQQIQINPPYIFSVSQPKSDVKRHFQTDIETRFTDVIALKPIPKLSSGDIRSLMKNLENEDKWLEYFPPDHFEFHGVISTRLIDVTENESLSQLKFSLLEHNSLTSELKLRQLEYKLCSYLGNPHLSLGITAFDFPLTHKKVYKHRLNQGLLSNNDSTFFEETFPQSIYEKTCEQGEYMVVEDIQRAEGKSTIQHALLKQGIKSLIIAPLKDKNNKIVGLLEVGAPEALELNSLTKLKLQEIVPLFSMAVERNREEIDSQIDAIIRQEYTAIHPTVSWKFEEVAFEIYKRRNHLEGDIELLPVRFHDVYPLYGQADIVNSSSIRNAAIQADLIDNLEKLQQILQHVIQRVHFPLIGENIGEIQYYLTTLNRGITANEESLILEFIRNEIHPLLSEIYTHYPALQDDIKGYKDYLDEDLQIVYQKRKQYEESVGIINKEISNYLDLEQQSLQEVFPHYYEKFQTDGIAYNIYIGASLVRGKKFENFHLRNLRLWQLISMCAITRRMDLLQDTLPVKLNTAQLILVHNTPISILFRLDEKRFDVDGAYNVRYEIIKKRIDKSLVEGTRERLTQAGKIAIVYTHEKDREEYMRHLQYLVKEAYIEEEIEELGLSTLQGVYGLRALRVTAKIKPTQNT